MAIRENTSMKNRKSEAEFEGITLPDKTQNDERTTGVWREA